MSAQGRIAAVVAAIGFAVEGIAVIGHKVPDSHWGVRGSIVDGAFAVAAVALVLALPALAQRLQVGRGGRIGCVAAQAGYAAMAVESLASLVHGGNVWGPVFVVGLLLVFAGLLTLAISGVDAGVARWAAPLPVIGMLVGIAGGDQGGSIALAVVWVVMAWVVGGAMAQSRELPVGAS